jgi:uncharacterized membrane protein YfcA
VTSTLVVRTAQSSPRGIAAAGSPARRVFVIWLSLFYTAWLVIVVSAGLWPIVCERWPVALAMAGGSFVGGSSPVAGGTIGFPLLVYVFNQPASLGRSFSLAIQSIGMVSASIYILSRGRTIEWRILRFALLGSAVAMPVGMSLVAPNVADSSVKILFSIVYASFGLLLVVRLQSIVANEGPSRTYFANDPAIAFLVGVLGGLLASLIGVGADILLYGTLVLLYHTDIKIAIPTSVILMAFTSVLGAGCSILAAFCWPGGRDSIIDVFPYWLAAAPVVAVGGPLGSLVSRFVPRRIILGAVAFLCLFQYCWTCYHEHLALRALVLAALGVIGLNMALHLLFIFGRRSLPLKV